RPTPRGAGGVHRGWRRVRELRLPERDVAELAAVRLHRPRQLHEQPEVKRVVERLPDALLDRRPVDAEWLAVELRGQACVAERLQAPGQVDRSRDAEVRLREAATVVDREVLERAVRS